MIHLVQTPLAGGPAYALQSTGEVLVRRDDQARWVPVDKLDKHVTNDQLERDYGLWQDARVTSGHCFWKKTERDLDQTPQADEVKEFGKVNEPYWERWVSGGEFTACYDNGILWKPQAEVRAAGNGPDLVQTWHKLDQFSRYIPGC